jgi:hypothetical protein
MMVWHVMFAADGRNTLFVDEGACLTAIRQMARAAGSRIVVFSVVDEHVHVVLTGDRQQVGKLARAITFAIGPLVAGCLDPSRIQPVNGRAHLQNFVRYVLDQPRHHGLPVHPALWCGSCFPDLIGARFVHGLQLRVRDVLPRFRLRDAYRAVGLPTAPLAPLADPEIRRAGAGRLVDAAAACLCVAPPLSGNRTTVTLARAAVARTARAAGIFTPEVAYALRVSLSAVSRLSRRPLDDRIVTGVRLRLALEDSVQRHRQPQSAIRKSEFPRCG